MKHMDKKPKSKKVKMRVAKYDELKALWETINQKALLQYKIKDEAAFLTLFTQYLRDNANQFTKTGIRTVQQEIQVSLGRKTVQPSGEPRSAASRGR